MLSQSKKDNTTTKVSPHPLWIVSSETAPIAGTGALNQEPTLYETVDRLAHAQVAKATSGLAPSALAEAYLDWAIHLAISPGKQMQLMEAALKNGKTLWASCLGVDSEQTCSNTAADRRFSGDAWQKYPFNVFSDAHMCQWRWWQNAMTGVHGVAPPHEDLMAFASGLLVDSSSPSNYPWSNPDVINATMAEAGQNFVRGAKHFVEDLNVQTGKAAPAGEPEFEVGRNLAITPGKVVFRNELVELIQYSPTTKTVRPEPILIVPAWIMKFYILDLSPENSMVRFLVSQGYSVFILSWKNPNAADRNFGMDDYRQLGIMQSLDAVQAITQAKKTHAVGYCLGGTLLSIAAAAMARDGDNRLATLTLLAAQTDFTEAGQLRLFINESEVTMIEDMMAQTGFLSSEQMSASFLLLRARDLIWGPIINNYFLGQRSSAFDLMTWNADGTRMPARMHSEYLRSMFLDNDLTEGRFKVGKKAIAISDIRASVFAVGTEDDHIAPWQSVYKLHLFIDTDVDFVLTSGGHNAGIVSEPDHHNRHFRIANSPADAPFRDAEQWLEETEIQEGSWWLAFTDWLDQHSGNAIAPPPMGKESSPYETIYDAPGNYVRQK